MLPSFIIIGAQKSGSTFLHHNLSDHPEIYMPDGEQAYFETPYFEENNSSLNNLERKFIDRKENVLGIKRPSYIGKPEVPDRITEFLPDIKLIAVLRNPIERIKSDYFHNINYGFIPPKDIELILPKIIKKDKVFLDKYPLAYDIIEFGFYYKYLSMFKHYFKNDSILILLFEEIQDQPVETIQKCYEFLNVDKDYVSGCIKSKPQSVVYNLNRLKILRLRNNFSYYLKDNKTRLFEKNKSLLDKLVLKLINLTDKMVLNNLFDNSKPILSEKLNRELKQVYLGDISMLENLINKNLSHWQ